ncbi:hypothetical protein Tco_0579808, partial [Tanacetum coccineum]
SDSGSDSEDSDYFVDEENLIEDVDVDMAEFKRHTDHGVEWLGWLDIRKGLGHPVYFTVYYSS